MHGYGKRVFEPNIKAALSRSPTRDFHQRMVPRQRSDDRPRQPDQAGVSLDTPKSPAAAMRSAIKPLTLLLAAAAATRTAW